ncbi:MAG: hypothetical protein WAU58_13420 [Terriglobales bacterium]
MYFTSESAKQFLVNRLEEQALHDGEPLSDIEKKLFLFSETSPTDETASAMEALDTGGAAVEFERKISKLLRRAYRHDQKLPDAGISWKQALHTLKNEDFYGLVMVEQAGLPVSKQGILLALLGMWPVFATLLGLGLPGFVMIFDPFHWGLIRSDWVRLSLIPVFVSAIWWGTNRVSESMIGKTRKP